MGRKAGSFGIGCFSFFPTKNITTAEGGMLTTNDENLAKLVRAYAGHGILNSTFEREKQDKPWLRAASYPGYNFRMSNIHAAIGFRQMEKIDKLNEKRVNASNYLTNKLGELSELLTPETKEGVTHVYQMYTVLLDPKVDRTKFLKYLNSKGIGASVHFDPPIHMQPYYCNRDFDTSDLEITEDVANRIVTLPMYPSITLEDLNYVVDKVKEGIYTAKC
jgi:perosamine synthetase